MTTKDQERKVLEQIRKLVAGLGEDSYVATAFEGCFEVAEENIRNDFACSMKQRKERAENELKYRYAKEDELKKELDSLRLDLEQKEKDRQLETHKAAEWKKVADEQRESINDIVTRAADLQKILDDKELEIIKLKAKIYDLQNA